jgi:hypothetical protein
MTGRNPAGRLRPWPIGPRRAPAGSLKLGSPEQTPTAALAISATSFPFA